MVAREEHYDSAQDILSVYGNRVSRLTFIIREYVAPKGKGADGARRSLALPFKSLVDLPADAPFCGQACLAYGLAHADPVLRGNMRGRSSTANAQALAVADALGVREAMGLKDFDLFASRFRARVVVLADKTEVLYVASPPGLSSLTVYLLFHSQHYFFISDIDLFSRPSERSTTRWCHSCLAAYTPAALRRHACLNACGVCAASFADLAERASHMAPPPLPACPDCGSRFAGAGCVPRHRCRLWTCPDCRLQYPPGRSGSSHVCRERYCEPCRAYFSETAGHRCFVRPLKALGAEKRPLWAFDLECARGPSGAQVLTVAVFRRLFADRELVVCRGESELFSFLELRASNGIFFSHNGAKYDTFLLFHLLLLRSPATPRPTFCGLKLLRLEWRGASFLDSFRHLGLSLESCALSFGLPLKKGFFPYDFYSADNSSYSGEPPPLEFFTPRCRSDPDFLPWYLGSWLAFFGGAPYDLAEECVEYCIQDVDILAAVLEHYREAALSATGVDPLGKTTIASFAMAAFRSRYLPEASVATLLPDEDLFSRRGLKGGRTDARQVLRSWGPEDLSAGRFGRYADVNSLYPWVLKSCPLPWGAPSWEAPSLLLDAEAYLRGLPPDAAALVECDVDCPPCLHHPVLVSTDPDGRLRATLEPKRQAVFTSFELLAALARGYRVTRAYRSLRFSTSTGSLFGPYIDFYYELKKSAAASGDRASYALSKMMMNSLWGKFAQRPVEGDVFVYKDPHRWYQDLSRSSVPGSFRLTLKAEAPEYILAERSREGETRRSSSTNSALAAFVTAHARLKLYEALEALGERVIYHDTDSVIYDGVPGDALSLPQGPSLGLWKDECAGSPIVRVCCLGPKTYAYLRADGVEVVKCKGFSGPFSLADYEAVARAFFSDGSRLSLSQPDLRFVRSLGSGISVVPGVKSMLPLMDKVVVLRPDLSRPRGFSPL
jgi:hypothetical protein